jgi:hypothetical protein
VCAAAPGRKRAGRRAKRIDHLKEVETKAYRI